MTSGREKGQDMEGRYIVLTQQGLMGPARYIVFDVLTCSAVRIGPEEGVLYLSDKTEAEALAAALGRLDEQAKCATSAAGASTRCE